MYCTVCGRKLKAEDRFCSHCGKPVSSVGGGESREGFEEVVFNPPFKTESTKKLVPFESEPVGFVGHDETPKVSIVAPKAAEKATPKVKYEPIEFNWHLDDYASTERRRPQNVDFDWGSVLEKKNSERPIVVEKIQFSGEKPAKTDSYTGFRSGNLSGGKNERGKGLRAEDSNYIDVINKANASYNASTRPMKTAAAYAAAAKTPDIMAAQAAEIKNAAAALNKEGNVTEAELLSSKPEEAAAAVSAAVEPEKAASEPISAFTMEDLERDIGSPAEDISVKFKEGYTLEEEMTAEFEAITSGHTADLTEYLNNTLGVSEEMYTADDLEIKAEQITEETAEGDAAPEEKPESAGAEYIKIEEMAGFQKIDGDKETNSFMSLDELERDLFGEDIKDNEQPAAVGGSTKIYNPGELEAENGAEASEAEAAAEPEAAEPEQTEAAPEGPAVPTDKFYTYNAKRDAFQELLENEKERLTKLGISEEKQSESRKTAAAVASGAAVIAGAAAVAGAAAAAKSGNAAEPEIREAEEAAAVSEDTGISEKADAAEKRAEEGGEAQAEAGKKSGKDKTKLRYSDVFPRDLVGGDSDSGSGNSGKKTAYDEMSLYNDQKKPRHIAVKIIVALLIIVILAGGAGMAARVFAPESKLAGWANEAIAKITEMIGIESGTGEEQPEEPAEENTDPAPEVSNEDYMNALITASEVESENIGKVVYSDDLTYDLIAEPAVEGIKDAERFSDTDWYITADGETVTYASAMIDSLMRYYDGWAEGYNGEAKKSEKIIGINTLTIGEIKKTETDFCVLMEIDCAKEDGEEIKVYESAEMVAISNEIGVFDTFRETV